MGACAGGPWGWEPAPPPADSRLSMPSPTIPSATTATSHAVSTTRGHVKARRVSAGADRPARPEDGCIKSFLGGLVFGQFPCHHVAKFIGAAAMNLSNRPCLRTGVEDAAQPRRVRSL